MLSKIYYKLKDKIEQIEAKLANNLLKRQGDLDSPRLFYFGLVLQNFQLITLEILSDLVKYLIILFSDPSQSFAILFKQKEQHSCPHSYTTYKIIQKKLRVFSTAGLMSLTAGVVIVSMVMNLILSPILTVQAATFGWQQAEWTDGASTTAYAVHNGGPASGWKRFASSSPSTLEASSSLALKTTTGPNASITQTTEGEFSNGNLTANELMINGTGADASLGVCNYNHNGANWTPTDNDGLYDLNSTGGIIEIAGNHCNINEFYIATGTTVWVKAYASTTNQYGTVGIYATSSTIAGTLDASGKGYAGGVSAGQWGQGPGGGAPDAGGAYGGNTGSVAYGSFTKPTQMGSGGGSLGAGNGGGLIRLKIINSLTINGNILLNGGNGAGASNGGVGAGSGGGLWITTNTFLGTTSNSILSVNGGNGGPAVWGHGGAGGGGRISIEYSTSTFAGSYRAFGGIGAAPGGAGTIYLKSTSQTYGDLIINNNNTNGNITPLFITPMDARFDNLTITNYAKLTNLINVIASNLVVSTSSILTSLVSVTALATINGQTGPTCNLNQATINIGTSATSSGLLNLPSGITDLTLSTTTLQLTALNIPGTLTVKGGSNITHPQGNVSGLTINANNIDLQSGGSINVDGKGYDGGLAGYGPGGSVVYGQGAGYGGRGGASGGAIYGATTSPTHLGSRAGGGVAVNSIYGLGGGYVRMVIGNSFIINGSISANGLNGYANTWNGSGGGSGGSIWITAGIILNSFGTTSAVGGVSNSGLGGIQSGGGGGGRIAIDGYSGQLGISSSSIIVTAGSGGGVGTKYGNGSPITLGEQIQKYADSFNSNQTISNISGTFSDIFTHLKNLLSYTLTTPSADAAYYDYYSAPIDTGMETTYKTITFTTLQSSSSDVTYQLATATSTDGPWLFVGPGGTSNSNDVYIATTSNLAITNLPGAKYLKYKATFDSLKDAYLDSITFNYTTTIYAPTGYLISSWYNTSDADNILGQINWTELALPANTQVRMQVRTATNTTGQLTPNLALATNFMGPDGATTTSFSTSNQGNYCTVDGQPGPCCSKNGATGQVVCKVSDLITPIAISTKGDDQWMQYQVWLESGNGQTPIVDDVELKYVVNSKPQARLTDLNVVQAADGTVTVNYQAVDWDTWADGGVWPSHVETNLEYYTPATGWNRATVGSTTLDISNPADWSATSTFVWLPRYEPGFISATSSVSGIMVRIKVDDHEGGNNSGYSPESTPTTMEVKKTAINIVSTSTIAQEADGTIKLDYIVNDPDCETLDTTGDCHIDISAEYYDPRDSKWHVSNAPTTTTDVLQGIWSATSTYTYDPRYDLDGQYFSTNFKVRLRADDHDVNNYISPTYDNYGHSSSSNTFVLDLKPPVVNQLNINASTQIGSKGATIYSTTTEDTLTNLRMYLTESATLDRAAVLAVPSGDGKTGWTSYSTTTTWQMSTSQSTIHLWLRDGYDNVVEATITPPEAPVGISLSDVSTADPFYQLFVSWRRVFAGNGFSKYVIWRATSTESYNVESQYEALDFTKLAEIATATDNWIIDDGHYNSEPLNSAVTYYYKVTMEDQSGNISRYLEVMHDAPDGQSLDPTPPVVSNVIVAATTTQTATIEWDTDELADSLLYYLTDAEYQANPAEDRFLNAITSGMNTYNNYDAGEGAVGRHRIIINKLEPNTDYHFKLTSRNAAGKQTEMVDEANYVFHTQLGPKITCPGDNSTNCPPTVANITNTSAQITWNTNIPADSIVVFSSTPGDNKLIDPVMTQGLLSTSTEHLVELSNLQAGKLYYFYIISTDEQGNVADDRNVRNSIAEFYSFVTKNDQSAPTISAPVCQPSFVSKAAGYNLDITATTSEPSRFRISYGDTSETLNNEQATSTDYNIDQQVRLTNLLASTTYHFRLSAQDASGNVGQTEVISCNTIEPMMAQAEHETILAEQLADKSSWSEVEYRIASSAARMATETSIDELDATSTLWVQIARQGWYSLTRVTAVLNDALAPMVREDSIIGRIASTSDGDITDATSTTWVNRARLGWLFEDTVLDRIASTSEELKVDNNASSTDSLATTWVKKAREAWVSEDQAKAREEAAKAAGTAAGKSSAGSSIIVIDKTDKVAPIISEVKAESITATSAVVSWVTNEDSDTLVKYGVNDYDLSSGDFPLVLNHESRIMNLEPKTKYSYRVYSADSSGNLAKSNDLEFTTPELTAEELLGISSSTEATTLSPENMQTAAEKLMSMLNSFSKIVSLGTLETTLSTQYDALDKIAGIIPAPILSGEPAVEITPTTATIRWHTDKAANSLIGYVPEAVYVSSRGDAAYTQTVGKSDELKSDHEVKIYNLKPETTYHFQLSSKAQFGPKATSKDFSFKTRPEALEITTYSVNVVSPTKAIFKWITSAQTNSQTKITPYRGSKLMVDEAKLYLDKTPTTNHETLIDNLIAGVIYNVSLSGVDQKGTRIEKVISSFSTTKDDLPPEITQIQTESALSQGKTIGVQTVIAWQTNEPTSCSIKYALGSKQEEKDLVDTTPAETGYSGKHSLVITKFKPGEVYSFRVYCLDSGDNQTISGTHTILTPKQRESVFDLIVRTMEQTFGWMGNVSK